MFYRILVDAPPLRVSARRVRERYAPGTRSGPHIAPTRCHADSTLIAETAHDARTGQYICPPNRTIGVIEDSLELPVDYLTFNGLPCWKMERLTTNGLSNPKSRNCVRIVPRILFVVPGLLAGLLIPALGHSPKPLPRAMWA